MLLLLALLACGPSDAELIELAKATRRDIAQTTALFATDYDPEDKRREARAKAEAIWCPKLEAAAGMPCAEALARYAP